MDTTAERFPLDFDTLRKGDTIPAATIERFRQVRCPGVEYRFAMLALRDLVRRELAIRGLSVVLVSELDDLRILTDAEAATYTSEEMHKDIRRAMRHHADQLAVDAGNLTADERRQHERAIEINGKYAQALIQAGSRYRLTHVHRRATPGLPSPEGEPKGLSDVREDQVQRDGDQPPDSAQRPTG